MTDVQTCRAKRQNGSGNVLPGQQFTGGASGHDEAGRGVADGGRDHRTAGRNAVIRALAAELHRHLRSDHSFARSQVETDHVKAKAEMLQMRLMQKQRKLVRREDCNELIDEVCGVVLTHLSGMAARCSRDMNVRRNIDAVVHQVRTELAQVCLRMADERGEPPLDQQVNA